LIELAVVTGWTPRELGELDDDELATLVDVVRVRGAARG
jgi:hypothetical protein